MDTDKMMKVNDITLYGGSLKRGDSTATRSHRFPRPYEVKNIFIHPGFAYYPVSQIFEKDIALVVPQNKFLLNSKKINK